MRGSLGPAGLVRLLGAWRNADGEAPRGGASYRALAAALRGLVRDGRIALHVRLPAERSLAAALGVSRTTVAAAFELLREDGYLISRRGSGSYTALPDGRSAPPSTGVHPLDPGDPGAPGGTIDLAVVAMPAPEPWFTRAAAEAVAELPAYTRGHGNFPYGTPALRAAIAERYTARGAPTSPEQIMVTTGAASGWALLLHELASAGDRIAVESPSYANSLAALRKYDARPVPIGLGTGPHPWDLDAWAAVLRQAAPRMAYVLPDFHNPAGHLMAEEDRARLVELARNAGTLLVVDETNAEMALDDPAAVPRPMAAFDRGGGTVVTIGSASKSFWTGLRIGWLRASPALVRRLALSRSSLDVSSPVLDELITRRLLAEGTFEEVLGHRRAVVRAGREAMVRELRAQLPEWSFTVPGGGLSLWVRIVTDGTARSGASLVAAAARRGVRVAAGTHFGVDGALDGFVRVPFILPDEAAAEAVRRLASAAHAEDGSAGAEVAVL
ncbi:hypothetical protein BIV57_04680 [Mangrovactinospora gilvigrisea]|uniref:HTH gntR-type domain-containing protein n=2 Tax=Mangrovactinospora gilvigrisea TaxID=1428644 RepID=A0A1J7CAY8_9ACTN|nr:hypothetical protein BIV57_04680 [Mangrovactinospora gilvigrisea]